MKKYIGVYMILFVILLIMFITGGIPYGNTVKEIELGWMDTGKTTVTLLTYNLIITIIVFVTVPGINTGMMVWRRSKGI